MHKVLVAAGLAVSLSACASTYVGKPYDRAAANVQSIGIADDALPEKATASEVASVGSNFGLVGALANAAIQQSREKAINDALAGAGFDAEARLEQRVITSLDAQGYRAKVEQNAVRQKRVYLASYNSAGDKPDAYLDIVVTNYGYLSAGVGQPWRPTVAATVRLVSASDSSKVLMENQIVYNGMYPQKGVITLSANPEYAFLDREDMLADPARLAGGIEDALNKVADTAVGLLR
ncbi:hypothetical protein [Caulobacter sp. 17J80-11]|uniref:hypothetical protein n=1 Tax=Caulobacter sp. 17J80-11 TaxID=2763502 RepID=UPI001653625B|nr:hypothetical protein [Caulobacter sp. 17J80-11]MBC6983154.1 hypothetical protein [Caulobacter sp. 17J80-11]